MSNLILNSVRSLSILVLVCAGFHAAMAQDSKTAFLGSDFIVKKVLLDSEPPPAAVSPTLVINGLLKAESRVRESLNHHSFRRDVILQTIGPNGEVTGEYIRNSQFIFDDRGNRIERVLYRPPSTICEMKITKEDIQDLAATQLLGIDVSESSKYQLKYVGVELVDGRDALAVDLSPAQRPDPNRMRERFFVGRVWIDPHTLQILKVRGITEPQGKQRFPVFETWREAIDDDNNVFPTRTEADDVLHFPQRDVHYRIRVRYYNYKRFGSKLTITEVSEEPAP